MDLPLLTADEVTAALSPAAAVAALQQALRAGFDPATDGERLVLGWGEGGQLLVMPAHTGDRSGVKILTVAPETVPVGTPRIQGIYLVVDPVTCAPAALLDGPAVTSLRTPAVSWTAVHSRLAGRAGLRVVVFGAGPQAVAHAASLEDVLGPEALRDMIFVHRNSKPDTAGLRTPSSLVAAGSRDQASAVREADVVVCATTAATPLFAAGDVRPDAVVVAVGSHEPDRRELPAGLLARAQVVVEDRATALREAGDVVLAVAEGAVAPADLVPLVDVVTGRTALATDRPVVFKSTGMSWEDLVVADAVLQAHRSGR
ncbi:ornithine cyclodeaminase family protein [Kineococcus sp. SYSU DK003]|uniref:ornithine cyclodeaminase family protein n=1 Tax=Kineococcus sp. SYSU DK003 TaxID=3383124 RepID=UPI003D7E6890